MTHEPIKMHIMYNCISWLPHSGKTRQLLILIIGRVGHVSAALYNSAGYKMKCDSQFDSGRLCSFMKHLCESYIWSNYITWYYENDFFNVLLQNKNILYIKPVRFW